MRATTAAVEATVGIRPRWFRPPFGRAAEALSKPALEAGLEVALWDVDARDWGENDSDAIAERVLTKAEAGSVIVLHDQGGDAAKATISAVCEIATVLADEGLAMVTVSELFSRNGEPA
jgi:peptidoglycan-N-acetylglucosamine deacetylase